MGHILCWRYFCVEIFDKDDLIKKLYDSHTGTICAEMKLLTKMIWLKNYTTLTQVQTQHNSWPLWSYRLFSSRGDIYDKDDDDDIFSMTVDDGGECDNDRFIRWRGCIGASRMSAQPVRRIIFQNVNDNSNMVHIKE